MTVRRFMIAILALCPASAVACPWCESQTGRSVQAGIFNDTFLSNLALLLCPFVIVLAVVTVIYGFPGKAPHGPLH
jgi:hypothetical protein